MLPPEWRFTVTKTFCHFSQRPAPTRRASLHRHHRTAVRITHWPTLLNSKAWTPKSSAPKSGVAAAMAACYRGGALSPRPEQPGAQEGSGQPIEIQTAHPSSNAADEGGQDGETAADGGAKGEGEGWEAVVLPVPKADLSMAAKAGQRGVGGGAKGDVKDNGSQHNEDHR
ncbi:unnamed protein product [Vitrella brassicaformis CCMP3155]|uniref:Uncharacterized protein n=1 Tax=Vitrella brassicaformis (strain CCMP3155) TaxID=1169540 RepID=A0A0G4EDP1_VITBC|nr:unnamed protein product [Vitrella brassicaformis CCMP3155]|eukprot:CEL93490.1 unnamed protein product [Vitrella brassicaformis CCMP3155]